MLSAPIRCRCWCNCRMRPTRTRLPVVSAIKVAFINPPEVALDFTGIANVADWSVVDRAVRKVIDDVLRGLMVLPQQLLVKLDPETSCVDAHQAPLGVCRVIRCVFRSHQTHLTAGEAKRTPTNSLFM